LAVARCGTERLFFKKISYFYRKHIGSYLDKKIFQFAHKSNLPPKKVRCKIQNSRRQFATDTCLPKSIGAINLKEKSILTMKLSFFLFALLAVETTTSVFADNVFTRANLRDSRIVGGDVAAKGDYPYFGE